MAKHLSFSKFQQSAKHLDFFKDADEIKKFIPKEQYDDMVPNGIATIIVYANCCYVEGYADGSYHLCITNDSFTFDNLARLELILYNNWFLIECVDYA